MNNMIEELCLRFTDLTAEDINILCALSPNLQAIANVENADVFIDCPTTDETQAIVVAEAKPKYVQSSYKKSVVGLMAKQENEPAVARSFLLNIGTRHVKAVTQEKTNVVQTVEPIRNKGKTIGVLIIEKRSADLLNQSPPLFLEENHYHNIASVLANMADENDWLTQYIDEALIMVDNKGIVCFRNSLAKELYTKLGYIEDILGMTYENILLHSTEVNFIDENARFSGVEVSMGKHFLKVKQILLNKNNISFAVIMRDITNIREKEKELILKSVAIQEMHHRVKNNLQTIASLLRLQGRRTANPETRKVLDETMSRILSIAATHELLVKVGVDTVDISDVLQNIKRNLLRYFENPRISVDIIIEGDHFKVDSDIATSVALVFNELLQNSLQYAFKPTKKGRITVTITRGDLYSEIEIVDNGIGFDITKIGDNSLGLSIVKSIIRDKLKGTLSIRSGNHGTKVKFDFRNEIIHTAGTT